MKISRKANRLRRSTAKMLPLIGALVIVVAILFVIQTSPGDSNNRLFAANCDSTDPGTNKCASDGYNCCNGEGSPVGCTWCYCGGCNPSPTTPSPSPSPTCSVTIGTGISSSSGPGYYRVNFSGQGGILNIWAINPNGDEYLPTNLPQNYISATANNLTHKDPDWASGPPRSHFYKIHSVACSLASGCEGYKDVNFPGNKSLYISCEVLTGSDSTQCSGNPYCSYESDKIYNHNCGSTWRSCSDSDNKIILSGRITNEVTGQPIWVDDVSSFYNTVGANDVCNNDYLRKEADSNGYYSVANVPIAGGFCIRVPASYTGYSSPKGGNGGSFECQKAGGYFNPDFCGRTGNSNIVSSNKVNYTATSTIDVGRVTPGSTTKKYVISGGASGNGYIDVAEWDPRPSPSPATWVGSHRIGDLPFSAANNTNFFQAAYNVSSPYTLVGSNVSFREVTDITTNYNVDVASDRNLDFTYRPDCNTCTPTVCNGTARCDQAVSGTGSCTATTYTWQTDAFNSFTSTNCNSVTLTNQPCTISQTTCTGSQVCSSGSCVTPPSGLSLTIGNNSNITDSFTSTSKISGLQSTQGGKGWYNPMTITLGATKGTGDIQDYYVAFYNSPTLLTSIVDTSATPIPVAALTGLAANDYFVLKYTPAGTGTWYVWDPQQSGANKWVDISSETSRGHDICSAACSPATLLYTAYPVSAASWKIRLDKNFGSKTLKTATYVVDSNSLSAFNANITPTYPP